MAQGAAGRLKVMNGPVRLKFANQTEVLAACESASNVVASPKPEEKPETGGTSSSGGTPRGEVRPAA